MEIIWRAISSEGERREWGNGAGNKKHNWLVQNRQGEAKNSIRNGEAKEHTCTTRGHELQEAGDCWREEGYRAKGGKGGKLGQL